MKKVVRFASNAPLLIITCHDEIVNRKADINPNTSDFFLEKPNNCPNSRANLYVTKIETKLNNAFGSLTANFVSPNKNIDGIVRYEYIGAF